MAIVTNNALGAILRGRVGDLIFKQYKDKVVVCAAPQKKPKRTANQKAHAKRVGMASRYSKAYRSNPKRLAALQAELKDGEIAHRVLVKEYLAGKIRK